MGGRGGHGHNDVLSCEVFLDGHHLVSDCGAFVYTADYTARNRFRSTACHNTPRIDGEEINRFVRPEELWWLRDDAQAEIRRYEPGPRQDLLVVAHSGYRRLPNPVTPVRSFLLEHDAHALTITDSFKGRGEHQIEVPMHLALGVTATQTSRGASLRAGDRSFRLDLLSRGWNFSIEPSEISTSYGVRVAACKLIWRRSGPLEELAVRLISAADGAS
jgi:hypothetical protein